MTYTPQTRDRMVSYGDLNADDEYFSPVLLDFLLFISEGILGFSPDASFPLGYDDLAIAASRIRGTGVQHEYLITVKQVAWNDQKQSVLDQLKEILSRDAWNGARLNRLDDHQ
jgi:hypothetical protein